MFITRMTIVNTVMCETRHSTADWDCFRTLDFAGDPEDSKSTSGGILYIFGSHTFVPHKLDVQETTFNLTQFDGIWDGFS